MQNNTNQIEPLTVTVQDAVRMTGLSQPTLYRRMKDGDLKHTHVGRRRLISLASLRQLVNEPC